MLSKYIPIESNDESLKDGTGYVIEDRENKKTDKSPILSGQIKINNIVYSIRGWEKINKSGTPFYSCSIKNIETINHPNLLDQIVEQAAIRQQHSINATNNDMNNQSIDEDVLSMFESNTADSHKSVFDNVQIDELIKPTIIRSDEEQKEIQNIFEKIESQSNHQSVFDNFSFEQSQPIHNSTHQSKNQSLTNDDSEIDELMRLLESQ